MKKYSFLLGAVLACAMTGGISMALALPASAASCPTITCGLNFVQTHVFNGGNNDGAAAAGVGVLSISGSSATISNVILNQNGASQSQTLPLNGTCTATSATDGTLDFSGSGAPIFDFRVAAGGNELRLIVPGISTTPSGVDSPIVGVCTAATALTRCPTSGTCSLLISGSEPTTTSPTPIAAVGTVSFTSGGGSFSGTLNLNGKVMTTTFSAACTVNNGIGTLDFSKSGGPVIDFVSSGSGYRVITGPSTMANFVAAGICEP